MKIVNGIAVIFGIVIMIVGISFYSKDYKISTSFSGSSTSSGTFGADFYTYVSDEIKAASDNAKEAGYTIASGFNGVAKEIEWACKIMGLLIFSIGGAITVYGANKLVKDIKFGKKETDTTAETQSDVFVTPTNNDYPSDNNVETENEDQYQQVEPEAEQTVPENEGGATIQAVDVNSTDELKGI